MNIFGGLFGAKKIKIYESRGTKEEWKKLRSALKEAGVKVAEANRFEKDASNIICGCGAAMDVRDYGENGPIDRFIYNIYVREQDADRARKVAADLGIQTISD